MKIRTATPEDSALLWQLIQEQVDEMGPDTRQVFDAQRVWNHLQTLWREKPSTHCLWVAENHQGHLVGMLLGCIQSYFWRTGHQAQLVQWYVHPSSRGSSAALRLALAFTAWSRQKQSEEIMIGITSGISPEKSHRLLARLGFVCVGRNYLRRLPCTSH